MIGLHILRAILHVARYGALFTYKVHGRENVPDGGPLLVATNHMSIMDSPLVFFSLPMMNWRLFAGEKWKYHPIGRPLLGSAGAIFINRGMVDRQALKEATQALKEGAVFGLAPEGRRSKDGRLARGRDGAAYLASRVEAPILPLGLVNTDQWAHNYRRLRITTMETHIGRPFELPDLGRRPRSRDLSAYTHLIMVKIAQLLPERYWGYYADSPALHAALRGEDPWPYCLEAEGVG